MKPVQFDVPTATITRVRFSSPDDPKSAWPAEAISQVAGDLLVARTKEGVDFLEGVLGAVTPETVEFKFQGETLHVKRAKVDGLVYFHKAGDKLPAAKCVVEGGHGWRLLAKSVALTDGQLEVAAVSGPTFIRPWDSIGAWTFRRAKSSISATWSLSPSAIPIITIWACLAGRRSVLRSAPRRRSGA